MRDSLHVPPDMAKWRVFFLLLLGVTSTRSFRFLPVRSPSSPALLPSCWAIALSRTTLTPLYSDAFFNFEGLQKRLNLTHFDDSSQHSPPPLRPNPQEDFVNRPDLVKAREIADKLAPEFSSHDKYPTVVIYFHVAAHHLQSWREALFYFIIAQKQIERDEEVFWEAFQHVGLPPEVKDINYLSRQAGRVPSRSRLALCGTFANTKAEERAKHALSQWRSDLNARLMAYRLQGDDVRDAVEVMPMSQAVYRRIRPSGPPTQPSQITSCSISPESTFLLSFLQASWSSERKIRRHLDRLDKYLDEVTGSASTRGGPAERAELYIDPSYPSAHRIWHQFSDSNAMVACLRKDYANFLEGGAKFRARVNHVEQVFAPVGCAISQKMFPPTLSRRLSSSCYMPLVGYGTRVYRGREREGTLTLLDAVRTALRAGCRLLDCSPDYGTQPEVGEALRQMFKAHETQRERLFIVSSLSIEVAMNHGDVSEVSTHVNESIQQLHCDYLDLLLLPYIIDKQRHIAAWKAMEVLLSEGVVRHIGVGGFPLSSLKALCEDPTLTWQPAVCQLEHHPFYRPDSLVEFCGERHIQLLANTPLGRPALSRPPGQNPLKEPLIEMSSTALECSPAQIALRWAVQQGVAVIPNSLCRTHILENSDLHSFTLAPFRIEVLHEMAAVRNMSFTDDSSVRKGEERAPYTLEEIRAHGFVYDDGGTLIAPGNPYEYLQLTIDVFERLDLSDVPELALAPREIDGAFPGMDVEPIECDEEITNEQP